MKKHCCITFIAGKTEPRIFSLDDFGKDEVRLGRGEFHGSDSSVKNDIQISTDISIVSRAHCTFTRTNDGWRVTDDNSFNGLLFNGAKISSRILHDGDKLYIGTDVNERCIIAFSSDGDEDSESSRDMISLEGKSRFIIGRSDDCDFVLAHPSVSRHHCIITLEGGDYFAADNGSMNGVLLNGSPLSGRKKLLPMDKITIADTTMVFYDGGFYVMKKTGGVSVVAHDLVKAVSSHNGEKIITDHVDLSIEPGEFTAIIGGSGAGKTTLLNCLSGMADFTSGDVLINGESIRSGGRSIRSIIGYVPQKDIVYDDLTLEHMLAYSAKLRMPKDVSSREIDEKISEVLDMVELTAHRKTIISRLSGGQKKRASIAVELLASPKLFFLDEPSSGLDPGTEKHLMQMLKKLAASGKTVIMVTHTVQNVGMCDRIICMGNGGKLCYSGKPSELLDFFGKKNMTDIYDDLNENSTVVSKRFRQRSEEYGGDALAQPVFPVVQAKKKFDLGRSVKQFTVMTVRYSEIMFNSHLRLILLGLMPVILTFIVCAAFQADGNLLNTLGITVNRTSLPFAVAEDTMKLLFSFSCAAFWVGIFNSVQEISKERVIYERERFAGIGPVPYVLSKFTVIGVLCMIQSAIMTALFIFFSDTCATIDGNTDSVTAMQLSMNSDGIVFTNGGMWFEFFLTVFLAVLSAMALGLAISAAVSNEMALVICPICLLPQILFSGVVCTLSGFMETISNAITCRWSCIAFFTSTDINSMYMSCKYDMGTWEITEFSNGFGVDEAYSQYTSYLFGLDPVKSAWVALLIMTVVCTAASVLFVYLKDFRFKPAFKRRKK
ncbi:MAG: ATP-binding cassette domain-containing protein [Oscillospiraceae bacterium]